MKRGSKANPGDGQIFVWLGVEPDLTLRLFDMLCLRLEMTVSKPAAV